MPIINRIQRRSFGGRILFAGFYVVLVFGAVWMVYPFLLMLSGSVKSGIDSRKLDVIPKYLTDDTMLFRKFLEQRYGRPDIAAISTRVRDQNGNRLFSFENAQIPPTPSPGMIADWGAFLAVKRKAWPHYYQSMGHSYGVKSFPEVTLIYQRALGKAFNNLSSRELEATIIPEEWSSRNYKPPQDTFAGVYWNMRGSLDDRYFYPVSIEGVYILNAVGIAYGSTPRELERLNREWGTDYRSTMDVVLQRTLPENTAERAVWTAFIKESLSPRFIHFDETLLVPYIGYLKTKYENLASLSKMHGVDYKDWSAISFPGPSSNLMAFNDAAEFVGTLDDLSHVSIVSPDFEWRDFLKTRYGGDIKALNQAWSAHLEKFDAIAMPTLGYDWFLLSKYKGPILRELLSRNYRIAWKSIVSNGHGLRNTIIFCLLNVVVALSVNPLAAYALSRFRPRWGQLALFLLMATMAFPAEVTQIPAFLLLRQLGWLNTFAALVIPAAANGYAIFLLKGFFDSLPQELYEAASLDGCGELRAFFTITIPLSTPILSVVALGAFTAAYGAFMFALLVCQKESMWTLMVYIYQMQQRFDPPVVFAALVIAAIPTLLVFIFCQNIIMRGIVVPTEK